LRASFEIAFPLIIGLEGKPVTDAGGYTKWGLASRYNPEVNKDTTLEEAKGIYLKKYWIPSGCDEAPFPLDICLFDGSVNPQNDPGFPYGANKEILALNPENWQEFMLMRMIRYNRNSRAVYREGHKNRILRLTESILRITKKEIKA